MSRQSYVLETEPLQPLVPSPAAWVPAWLRWSGLVVAAYVAGVHLGLCDATYKEAPYLGAAFVAGALVLVIGASIAAGGRRFGKRAAIVAWSGDAIVMVAALLTFVVSRGPGLPSYHHSDWPSIQVIAMVAEVAYLVLTGLALRRLRRR